MDWNYFKIRRRTTLEKFLNKASSEEEALEIFSRKGLTNIPLDEIKSLFDAKQSNIDQAVIEAAPVNVTNEEISLDAPLPTKTKVTSGTTVS